MLRRIFASASIAFALSLFSATGGATTAQRTFVASTGNDANPCSLVMPCRTFGAALVQTLPGGEIIVLDSAGYGTVTITQSVSIIAPAGVYAGISVPTGGTGVAIPMASGVVLRGLAINSTGGAGYGIRKTGDGGVLFVEDCEISNFSSAGSGYAVSIEGRAIVTLSRTVLRGNDWGVFVGYGSTMNIANSQFVKSIWSGIYVDGDTPGATTRVFVSDTLLAGWPGLFGCVVNNATGSISLTRVTATDCLQGITNNSATGTITVSGSMVTGNNQGLVNAAGTFSSLGTSQVSGNTTDVSGTITLIGGQ